MKWRQIIYETDISWNADIAWRVRERLPFAGNKLFPNYEKNSSFSFMCFGAMSIQRAVILLLTF